MTSDNYLTELHLKMSRKSLQPNLQLWGSWEETRVAKENPNIHKENLAEFWGDSTPLYNIKEKQQFY